MARSLDVNHGTLAALTASAVEVYPKETAGLLFGMMDGSSIRCTMCQPFQEAHRTVYAVNWDAVHHERVKKSVIMSTGFKFLGIYHSHPNAPVKLSPEDVTFMRDNKCTINLVISLVPKGVGLAKPWARNGLDLQGFVHGFETSVGSFHLEGKEVTHIETHYPLFQIANLLQRELKIDLYSLSSIPDKALVLLHYWLDKIEYHVRRDKQGYSDRKIDYATSKILLLLRPFVEKTQTKISVSA